MIFHTWWYNLCTRVFPFVARMSCTHIWMLKFTCHGMIIVHINTFLCQTLWSVRPLSCIQWCFNSPWNMNMANSFSGTSPFLQIPINIFVWNPQSLVEISLSHDDVIKWKHFPRYWPFLRGIHWSPVNSPHKGQWRGALMFSLIYAWINGWVNNDEAGDLIHHRANYDVTVLRV